MPFQKGNKIASAKRGKRHKKTLEVEAAQERIKKKVFARLDPIIDAQIDLAEGCMVEEYKLGGKRIYSKPPDKGAAEMLLAHSIGKPTETVKHQGQIKITELIIDC